MAMNAWQMSARDGHGIAVRCYEPDDGAPVRRAVLIAAAMGVPQRFYEAYAQWLATQGVAVLTFDWRGIGESAPKHLRGFKASITDWAMLDLNAAVDALCERFPAVPRSYLGHSLGGQLFGLVEQPERFAQVLNVAAGSGYWRWNAGATRLQAPFLWWLLVPVGIRLAGYFPGKRIGAVGDLPAAAMWQWRKWCLHPEYIGAEGAQLKARFAAVKVPITSVIVDDDELLSPHGIRQLYKLFSGTQVHFEQLHPRQWGMKHIGHFGVFRKSAAERIWPATLQWLGGEREQLAP
jgi:predicted alpha/beta hydrolase